MKGADEIKPAGFRIQNPWNLLIITLVITIVVFIYILTRVYVTNQVEKRVRDMMLECRAFHQYIQRDMHPEYYRLMDSGRLPEDSMHRSYFRHRILHETFKTIITKKDKKPAYPK